MYEPPTPSDDRSPDVQPPSRPSPHSQSSGEPIPPGTGERREPPPAPLPHAQYEQQDPYRPAQSQYEQQDPYRPAQSQYEQQGPFAAYAPVGPGGFPPPTATGAPITLGPRPLRRPEPRAGVSIAAAGAVLLIVGALVWAGGYFGSGVDLQINSDTGQASTSGDARRFLGAGLFLVAALGGYALMIIRKRGPLASAGTVAAGIGVPLAIGFVSLSVEDTFRGSFPINIDAVFLASILVWVVSYLLVPGARGRAFFLAAAALALSSYVGFKAAGDSLIRSGVAASTHGGSGIASFSSGTLAAVGISFGLLYYGIAAVLDRSGRPGAAVAFVVAGFAATASGIIGGAAAMGLAGTGVALLLLGALLTFYGGYFGRRLTSWVWAGAFVLGIFLLVAKISPDNYTAAGISMIVLGAIVVLGGHVLATLTRESPDIDDSEPVPAR